MSTLDISKVVCYPTKFDSGASIGFGMITFQEVLTVKFNILKSRAGDMFVTWPQRKKNDEDGYNYLVTFDDKDVKEDIQRVILDEFAKVLKIEGKPEQKKSTGIRVTTSSKDVPAEESAKPEAKSGSGSIKWPGVKK